MKQKSFLSVVIPLIALGVALGAAGCGGGSSSPLTNTNGSSNPGATSTSRVAVTVQWPERSRDIAVPASALSLIVTLRGANPDGSDFIFTINRGDNPAAFTQTYTSPNAARVGEWNMEVACHADTDGAGDVVGEASAAKQRLESEKRPLASLTAERRVASVEITPGQTVTVGERRELAYTARDAQGNILTLKPGAAFFTVVDGGDFLRFVERKMEGLHAGTAHVTVRVDDVTSAPAVVTVLERVSEVHITVQPESLTLPTGGSETLTATVTGPTDTGVTWSVQEGADGGTVTDGGRYTAPETPGTYHVIAASKADSKKTAIVTIIVTAAGDENLRKIELATNDLVYDPVSARLWASVPARAGSGRANTVTAINPVTATVGDSFPVGSEPDKLALRGNSQILWVGVDGEKAIRRFNIAPHTTGPLFALGSDEAHGRFIAEDIEVMPEKPETIAVARRNVSANPRHEGVVIYDNGTARTKTTERHNGSTAITFSAQAGKLYGFNGESTEFGFRRMEIGTDGVRVVSNTLNLLSGLNADIRFDDGRLYSSTGRVINPETQAVLGTFPEVGEGALVLPDSARGVVYFLTGDGTTRKLRIYNRNTYQQVAVREIPGVQGKASSLVRWGDKGLAFRTSENQVFILRNVPAL